MWINTLNPVLFDLGFAQIRWYEPGLRLRILSDRVVASLFKQEKEN